MHGAVLPRMRNMFVCLQVLDAVMQALETERLGVCDGVVANTAPELPMVSLLDLEPAR